MKMIFINNLVLFVLFKVANSLEVEDLKLIFANQDCIPGSVLSLKDSQSTNKLSDINQPFQRPETIGLSASPDKSVLSQLQELAQYHSIGASYELITEEGPSHNPTFTVNLYLGDETYTAVGNSLKEAKRNAAKQAIKNTKFEHPPVKIRENEKVLTPTVLLNNLAAKLGLSVTYAVVNNDIVEELQVTDTIIESRSKKSYLQRLNDSLHLNETFRIRKDESNLKGPFKVKVLMNGEKFIGVAHTIQNAKHEAASKALKRLKTKKDEDNLHCLKEGNEVECKQAKQMNKSPISLVYEAAQKHSLDVEFEIVEEKGPSHKKTFVMRCHVGDLESTGEGSSKKLAKKTASENMLQKLKNLPVPEDKNSKEIQLSPKESKNEKKRKRKKNKIIKTTLDKIDKYVENFVEFGADFINKLSGKQETKTDTDSKNDNKKMRSSPIEEILELGKMLNLDIQFSEVEDGKKVFTVIDLGTNPSYLCLGEGVTQKNSRDLASRNGIKFLYQLGFLDNLFHKTIHSESEKEDKHRFWLQVIEEDTNSA